MKSERDRPTDIFKGDDVWFVFTFQLCIQKMCLGIHLVVFSNYYSGAQCGRFYKTLSRANFFRQTTHQIYAKSTFTNA